MRIPFLSRFGRCFFVGDEDDADDDMMGNNRTNGYTPRAQADLQKPAQSAVASYLESLDMSAAEMIVSSLAVGLVVAVFLCPGHILLQKTVIWFAKEKLHQQYFQLPASLLFPAPEILGFFLYYPGIIQASLITTKLGCELFAFRALGLFVVLVVVSIIISLAGWLRAAFVEQPLKSDAPGAKVGFLFRAPEHASPLASYRRIFRCHSRGHLAVGEWQSVDEKSDAILHAFDGMFSKFKPSGIYLYFGDALRKFVFLVIVTFAEDAGLIQVCVLVLLSVCGWLYVATQLPFNTMRLNIGELVVEFGRITTSAVPLLGYLGIFSWDAVSGLMIYLHMGTIGVAVLRQISAVLPGIFLVVVTAFAKISGIDIGEFQQILRTAAEKTRPRVEGNVRALLRRPSAIYAQTFKDTHNASTERCPRRRSMIAHESGISDLRSHFNLAQGSAGSNVVQEHVRTLVMDALHGFMHDELLPDLQAKIAKKLPITFHVPKARQLVERTLRHRLTRAVEDIVNLAIDKVFESVQRAKDLRSDDDPDEFKPVVSRGNSSSRDLEQSVRDAGGSEQVVSTSDVVCTLGVEDGKGPGSTAGGMLLCTALLDEEALEEEETIPSLDLVLCETSAFEDGEESASWFFCSSDVAVADLDEFAC